MPGKHTAFPSRVYGKRLISTGTHRRLLGRGVNRRLFPGLCRITSLSASIGQLLRNARQFANFMARFVRCFLFFLSFSFDTVTGLFSSIVKRRLLGVL